MGCISSRRVNDRSANQSIEDRHAVPHPHEKATSIQDDARSFRSKVGALKMLIRTPMAYESILKFLNQHGRGEYLVCYRDMEEIKALDDDQMVSRTAALIWRYKTSYEAVRARGHVADTIEYRIWECFGKLRQLDIANAPADVVKKYLIIAQNEIMARLVIPFDDYLLSPNYKEWQDSQIEAEKQRRQQIAASRQVSRDNSVNFTNLNNCASAEPSSRMNTINSRLNSNVSNNTPLTTLHANMTTSMYSTTSTNTTNLNIANNTNNNSANNAFSPALLSDDFAICAADYPDVLIVDDSLVTLKITGLTLERDGHNVERASNGQIALQLMKSRPYDVVLIDCNMPVMDGFEAVRLFREHERSINNPALFRYRRRPGEKRRPLLMTQDPNAIKEESEGDLDDNEDDDLSDISDSDDELFGDENSVPQPLPAEPTNPQTKSQPVLLAFPNNDNSNSHNVDRIPGERQMRRTLTNEHYHQLIIGMSTSIDDETRDRALKAGMDFFLPKPFTLQKFIETLRQSRELKKQLWMQTKAGLVVDSLVQDAPNSNVQNKNNSGFSHDPTSLSVDNNTIHTQNVTEVSYKSQPLSSGQAPINSQ